MERFRKLRGRMADRMAGPDLTSWAGLWKSLESASGAKLLPLLTSVMEELQVARQTQQQQQHGQLVSGAALPLPDAAAAVSDAVAAILPPTAALSPVRTSKAAPDAWTHLEGPCEGSCPEVGDAEVGDVAELARRDTSTSSAGGRASSPTTAGIAARRVSKPTSGPFEYSGSSPPLGTISSTSDSALHARQHHPASSLAAATSAHTGGGGHHSVASPVSNVIDKITHRTRSVKVPADWATGEDDGAAALDANSKQTSELAA